MPGAGLGAKSCHTCRRRRLRCDRSLPVCMKCIKTGQECLGYERLFLWDQGVASRGKMRGKTFEDLKQHSDDNASSVSLHIDRQVRALSLASAEVSPNWSLTDPIFHGLPRISRYYLAHFISMVCKELVLYDSPRHNLFYELIPQMNEHKVLLYVLTAISALHMSNTCQISHNGSKSLLNQLGTDTALEAAPSTLPSSDHAKYQEDALKAKQTALSLLVSSLNHVDATNIDALLAATLLFVELELMDSGKDNWKQHVNGARALFFYLLRSAPTRTATSLLRNFLLSNWLVYDIIGSTLAQCECSSSIELNDTVVLSLLNHAEANNYLSCPAVLLQIALAAVRLSHRVLSRPEARQQDLDKQTLLLLNAIESFAPESWATSLQRSSPEDDLSHRTHIASAHKAAMYIFVIRILSPSSIKHSADLENQVSEIVYHISCIPLDSPLFKATSWPTFVAGAETSNRTCRQWAEERFRSLYGVLPWGYMRSALSILGSLWQSRKSSAADHAFSNDWVRRMRGLETQWLIA